MHVKDFTGMDIAKGVADRLVEGHKFMVWKEVQTGLWKWTGLIRIMKRIILKNY